MTTTAEAPTVSATKYVNGVFKGGGAKGVAYAGALAALCDEGIWFKSVAGASAGAITAALIAAGMKPSEIETAVPTGLKAAGSGKWRRLGLAVIGEARSVYTDRNLRQWLDDELRKKIAKPTDGPVTFAELYAASPIDLYVVVMDVAARQPVVFNRRTTPDVEVAGAVASSSAIPGAFPAGRGVFSAGDGSVIHQFVDGGSWANYPAFVFEDMSFRTWVRQEARSSPAWDETSWVDETQRPVVGFILGSPVPMEHRRPIGMIPVGERVSRRFDLGPSYTSSSRGSFMFGWLLSSDWARSALVIALGIWVTMSIVTLPVGMRRYASALQRLPDTLYPAALVISLTIVVLAAVLAIAFVAALVIVGRLIADTMIPTFSALIAVPTDVTPWIGLDERSIVLRVPHGELDTTTFDASQDACDQAVEQAFHAVQEQLRSEPVRTRLRALVGVEPGTSSTSSAPVTAQLPATTVASSAPDRMSLTGLVIAGISALVVGGLGTGVAATASTAGLPPIGVLLLIGLVGVGAAFWRILGRTELVASKRASRGITDADVHGIRASLVSLALGLAAVIGGFALSASAMHERAATTRAGQVTAATSASGGNHYTVELRDGSTVELETDRHLRLGERIFVRTSGGPTQLAGAIGGFRVGLAVTLVILGAGLLSSAARRWSWVRRCRRLQHLARAWTA